MTAQITTTLPQRILDAVGHRDDAVLVDGPSGAPVTGASLRDRVQAVAAGLADRGLGAGDVVALWLPNVPPWLGLALGAMRAGCTVTGIGPSATADEARGQVRAASADVLVTTPDRVGDAARIADDAGIGHLFVLGPGGGGATPVTDLLGGGAASPADDTGAVALLPFSSGTTGLPKGVMLTHANLTAAIDQGAQALRLRADDTVIAIAPFAHVMGFVMSAAMPLSRGARVVTMPRFEPERFLALAEEHRASVLIVPPPVLALLARHPGVARRDLSAVRVVVSGGAPAPPALQAAVGRRFPGAVIGQGYGLTETAAMIAGPDPDAAVPGCAGRIGSGTEHRVVDPATGSDVPPGEPGELWVRGPQVMAGYLDDPEATAAMIDAAGWLHTGDLCRVTADRRVFVVDRLKELIKVDAYQVPPAELELLLLEHPSVADAAVIARPDERHGEVPVALVVPAVEAFDAGAVLDHVHARVAAYKRLHAVHLVDALPRTPAGKLLRRRLAEPRVAAV